MFITVRTVTNTTKTMYLVKCQNPKRFRTVTNLSRSPPPGFLEK